MKVTKRIIGLEQSRGSQGSAYIKMGAKLGFIPHYYINFCGTWMLMWCFYKSLFLKDALKSGNHMIRRKLTTHYVYQNISFNESLFQNSWW